MASDVDVEKILGEAIPVPVSKGSVILFHNLCFHGSGSNGTRDRTRWTLDWCARKGSIYSSRTYVLACIVYDDWG